MAYTYEDLQKDSQETKELLGISYTHLTQLIKMGFILDKKHKEKVEQQKTRLIRQGGGAKEKLTLENQIILTLTYLRQGLTFRVLGKIFNVSKSTAHNIFHYWLKIWEKALPPSLVEQVKKSGENEEQFLEFLRNYELIVDSSEQQPRERPVDNQKQKDCYSNKKHTHTAKNQLIVLPNGADIVDVALGKRGPMSDINLWRERQNIFHPEQKFAGDKAYVGESQIKAPHKKPKNQELTAEKKAENKQFSSVRICVEHVIRTVKNFRVAREKFRLNMDKYEGVISVVCGLARLRTGALILDVLKAGDRTEEPLIKQYHLWSSFLI